MIQVLSLSPGSYEQKATNVEDSLIFLLLNRSQWLPCGDSRSPAMLTVKSSKDKLNICPLEEVAEIYLPFA